MGDEHLVSDHEFKRLVAILRLSVPYTGMILTAREKPEIRNESSWASACRRSTRAAASSSAATPRPATPTHQVLENEQFELGDVRSLDDVIKELVVDGYMPSFCTACYRLGRTGEEFMEFAIPGFIEKFCTPNACTTLMEYLVDYAKPETVAAIETRLAEELERIDNPRLREAVVKRMDKIKNSDSRDLYF
jgi:2-iminoacetate synthase